MASLSLKQVCKQYGDGAPALHEVDLEVADGEFLVLVGPSGCGKSTLLRIVAGLVEKSGGEVRLDGQRVDGLEPGQRDVAMVFQNYALYPHMSVARNLGFPLRMARLPKAQIEARVREVAEILGLEQLLERRPGQLSGGQMQRVAVGRAIVRKPRLFLFDEPLSNLDAKLRGDMRLELQRLHQRLGITTLYVTHDQAEAMTLGDRIAVLEGGRLQQVDRPMAVFERPATRFVGAFIGSPPMNQIRGQVRAGVFEAGPLRIPCPLLESGEVWLGVRSHRISDGQEAHLRVRDVEALGTRTLVTCELAGAVEGLRVSWEGHRALQVGSEIGIACDPTGLHWFDAQTERRLESPDGVGTGRL